MDEEVIPILRIDDAALALPWYERLGFVKQWEHRFEPGFPLFVEVARGSLKLFLSEHRGDAKPGALVYLRLNDADRVAAEFGRTVEETEWHTREVELSDPDGNRFRIAAPTD